MSAPYFESKTHFISASHIRQYPQAISDDQHRPLHLAVKQYTPRSKPSPSQQNVTIVAAHANGVGKEMYEPLWDDLFKATQKEGKVRIKSIWIADCVHQGESGVLNEQYLGDDTSWYDHARDLLHMVNTFRDEITMPIVGVGHSMGGIHIVNLSLMHPRLFACVILIDPVIQRTASSMGSFFPAFSSTFRRDLWPSREKAVEAFKQNPFYLAWDERVLELWIQFGLRDLPTALHPEYPADTEARDLASALANPSTATSLVDAASTATSAAPVPASPSKPVTLTTTKHQEVFTFLRSAHPPAGQPLASYTPSKITHPDMPETNPTTPFYRPEPVITFSQLPFLRPRTFYIFAEKSPLSAPVLRNDKLEVTGTGVSGNGGVKAGGTASVTLKGAGHFVCFERVGEVANVMGAEIERSIGNWNSDVELLGDDWQKMDQRQKSTISNDREWWTRMAREGDKAHTKPKL